MRYGEKNKRYYYKNIYKEKGKGEGKSCLLEGNAPIPTGSSPRSSVGEGEVIIPLSLSFLKVGR